MSAEPRPKGRQPGQPLWAYRLGLAIGAVLIVSGLALAVAVLVMLLRVLF